MGSQAAHAFRDEGYSGARLDRPGLDALRDAVRDAEIDIVAVLSPDRLARKYAYQALVLEEFRRAGCAVTFLNHTISDNPGDQLLLQIQGAVAEYERALLGDARQARVEEEADALALVVRDHGDDREGQRWRCTMPMLPRTCRMSAPAMTTMPSQIEEEDRSPTRGPARRTPAAPATPRSPAT